MNSFARLIAHALVFLRKHALPLLALVQVAQSLALGALFSQRLGVGPSATFISANGTTSAAWQVAGPSGPALNASASTSTFTLGANDSLAGAAGTGSLSFANMTGSSTFPTGAFTVNSTTGLVSLDSPGIFIGNNISADVVLCNTTLPGGSVSIGDQTGTNTNQTFQIGYNTSGGSLLLVNNATAGTNELLTLGPNFVPNADANVACGTGGTQTVTAGAFKIAVSSGTLSSNCTIDFTTNNSSGLFFMDMTNVTVGSTFGVQFKNGSTTSPLYTTASVFSGKLAVAWTAFNAISVNW